MRKVAVLVLLTILGSAQLTGCGGSGRPKLVKTSGKLLLNGAPVEGATVTFQFLKEGDKGTYGRPSYATTDAQGAFAVSTYGTGDGMPPGKYKVTVFKQEVVGELPKDYNPENPAMTPVKFQWTVPKYYSDPATSGIDVEVTSAGLQPETIDLKSEGKVEIESSIPQRRANDP